MVSKNETIKNDKNDEPDAPAAKSTAHKKSSLKSKPPLIRNYRYLRDENLVLCLVAVFIGVLTGYIAIGFRYLINTISNSAMYHKFSIAPADPQNHINGLYIIIVPVIGGLIVGLIIKYLAPEAKGHGVPEVMEAVAKYHGIIRARLVVVKALASALTIGTGGSVGREGPIVHMGSALGSTVGQLFKIKGHYLKILVGCGAAGGIAATFNTPISGVLFAFELIVLEFKTRSFVPLVISSVFATMISRYYLGQNPAFSVPHYAMVNRIELLFYLGLGVIAAFVAVLQIKMLYKMEDIFDKIHLPGWIKPGIGGLLIGIIAVFYPQIMGIGYYSVDAALSGELAFSLLLTLAFLKIVALSLTIGSGGSGGVFAPTLFIGSMVGGAYGYIIHHFFPAITASYGAYALVAMAALFAGATRATLTAVIMLFEMTRDYEIILPLMFACVVADLLAWKFQKETIYTKKLTRRGTYIPTDMQINILDIKTAADVTVKDIITVEPTTTLEELEVIHRRTGHHGFPVVSGDELIGIITEYDLACCKMDDKSKVTAKDIMKVDVVTVVPTDSLQFVYHLMRSKSIYHIPVVDRKNRKLLRGYLTKKDLLGVISDEL